MSVNLVMHDSSTASCVLLEKEMDVLIWKNEGGDVTSIQI
jgi:hypothetical protein